MVVTSGNIMLMARAAQMVLTCSPASGVTPAGNAKSNTRASTGALAASNSACVGLGLLSSAVGAAL